MRETVDVTVNGLDGPCIVLEFRDGEAAAQAGAAIGMLLTRGCDLLTLATIPVEHIQQASALAVANIDDDTSERWRREAEECAEQHGESIDDFIKGALTRINEGSGSKLTPIFKEDDEDSSS